MQSYISLPGPGRRSITDVDMNEKPTLLFISPTVPHQTGNGRSMRAFHTLAVLSRQFSISLLVVPSGYQAISVDERVRALCTQVDVLMPHPIFDFFWALRFAFRKFLPGVYARISKMPLEWCHLSIFRRRLIRGRYGDKVFDVIHVFRLYAVSTIGTLKRTESKPYFQLDIDDFESETRFRMAELHRARGSRRMSGVMYLEGKKYGQLERAHLPQFDKVFVSSGRDKVKLGEKNLSQHIEILPNVVEIPKDVPRKSAHAPFAFLFLGSLHYFPNEDALFHLKYDILPAMLQADGGAFRILVVGGGLANRFSAELREVEQITLVGEVEDVAPCYAAADAVVIPIRSGGGTRIKILEAFAYKKPVISTSMGMEGIEAVHGADIMIADTPEDFARCCQQVMADQELRERLVTNAYDLVTRAYSLQVLMRNYSGMPWSESS
jgi:glycosyltransferase involved in cell wall biosynthesis